MENQTRPFTLNIMEKRAGGSLLCTVVDVVTNVLHTPFIINVLKYCFCFLGLHNNSVSLTHKYIREEQSDIFILRQNTMFIIIRFLQCIHTVHTCLEWALTTVCPQVVPISKLSCLSNVTIYNLHCKYTNTYI